MRTDPAPNEDVSGDVRLFRDLGVIPTRPRLLVLSALTGRDSLVSAQDLHRELRSANASIGLNSIYRTLHLLTRAGELHELSLHGQMLYRRCSRTPHHHLICTDCARVWEENPLAIQTWVDDVASRPTGQVLESHAHILLRCNDCQTVESTHAHRATRTHVEGRDP